jgi:hypothetical protein
MSQRALEEFGAYRKSGELGDPVLADRKLVQRDPLCFKLVSQPVADALYYHHVAGDECE